MILHPSRSPKNVTFGPTTGRLPDDFLAEQVKRLALLSIIGVGLWTFGLVLETLLYRYREYPPPTWRGVTINLLGIAGSVAMFVYLRHVRHSPQTKTRVALIYLLHALSWGICDVIGGSDDFWLGFLITGVLILVIGIVAGLLAMRFIKRGSPPTPQMAIEEGKLIKETVTTSHPALPQGPRS